MEPEQPCKIHLCLKYLCRDVIPLELFPREQNCEIGVLHEDKCEVHGGAELVAVV